MNLVVICMGIMRGSIVPIQFHGLGTGFDRGSIGTEDVDTLIGAVNAILEDLRDYACLALKPMWIAETGADLGVINAKPFAYGHSVVYPSLSSYVVDSVNLYQPLFNLFEARARLERHKNGEVIYKPRVKLGAKREVADTAYLIERVEMCESLIEVGSKTVSDALTKLSKLAVIDFTLFEIDMEATIKRAHEAIERADARVKKGSGVRRRIPATSDKP